MRISPNTSTRRQRLPRNRDDRWQAPVGVGLSGLPQGRGNVAPEEWRLLGHWLILRPVADMSDFGVSASRLIVAVFGR